MRPASRLQSARATSPVKSTTTPSTSRPGLKDKRGAVFVDVVFADCNRVLPLSSDAWDLPSDYDQLASRMFSMLGTPLGSSEDSSSPSEPSAPVPGPSSKPMTTSNLHLLGTKRRELVETERTLVNRLTILQEHYARPLADARGRDGQLLVKKYHHNRMFNNLERLVEAHRILDDRLQNVCMSNDPLWAHVLADHLERNLQQYVAYFAGYEHGSALARSYSKNSKQFEDWADNVKYQTSNMPDCRNSDLLALLAELVQRVPRYKYMLKDMLPLMPQDDPNIPYIYQIYQLVDDISKYRDEEGRRAAILWSMSTTVQDLPFTLWSSQRRYLATIDVEDLPLDIRHTFSLDGRGSPDALSCSLFLFTDCLLIAKRPDVRSSGRQLVGLDDIDALVHASNQPDFTNINHSSSSGSNKLMSPGSPAKPRPQSPLKTLHHQRSASSFSLKKHSLKARGLVPLQHITATDLGAKGFVLHLAQPPSDSNWSKRWNDQSLRHYAVSLTSGAGNPAIEKNAFLDALWDAQARCSGKTFVTSSGAPPASPTKKPVSEVQSPPCTIYKSSVAQVREAAEWPISDAMRSSQEWNVYFAAWPADEYGASDGTKNRLAVHIDVTGHASSRLVLNQHGPPHVVANARVESQEAFFVDVMARGKTEAVMSDSNICPANVLANSVQAALNLGAFNYVPKLAPPSRPPATPPVEHARTRTGSLFGSTALGKSSMRNSVFGGSTVSNSSRNTDTIRSGASSSTTGASSLWSGYMASSTAASSTYSDTEDSPVMVQRDPSYEEVHSRGVLPTPTKVRSKISSPPSAIPKHVAQDESLMRARNFGSHSSISQLLNDPPLLPQSSSEESMGKSHSANELYTSQPASNTEDRRRRAISVPPETEAPEPKESKSPRYRKPVPSFGHSERQGTPTSTFDEPEPPSTSRNPKRTLDQDVAVPLHTKKSAVSSLSIAVPVADAQQPPNKGRRSASGGNRRISLQDRPTPVPTPPPKDDHDQTEMIKLRQALRQAQQENDLLKSQQKQLDEEVQTAFDAFNEEIEQVYNDMEQGHPELQDRLLSDLQVNKLARYAAEVELRNLRRETTLKDLKLKQYEDAYGPLSSNTENGDRFINGDA